MSETFFPINDLMRRKFQTFLTVISLTLCVASTFFLLLFSERTGFGIFAATEEKLTASFSNIFSQLILFLQILIFIVGVVVISFMTFLMMRQRVRDIGLMKAAGCPNDLIFGYFMTELLIITFVGCFLGVLLGLLADFFTPSSFFNEKQALKEPVGFLSIIEVFLIFFVLSLIIGGKTIFKATKVEPAKAISSTYYFGLDKGSGFKTISGANLTIKIALRSMFRRKSATVRILACLTSVFFLLTISIAGGMIAWQTTGSWVERAIGKDLLLIAHKDIGSQYVSLLSKFYETNTSLAIDYANETYLIPQDLISQLGSISGKINMEQRLVLYSHIKEMPGYLIEEITEEMITVGDAREGESLIIGIQPEKVLNNWFLEGEFFKDNQSFKAMVGDSLAQKMFDMPLNQSITLFDNVFEVSGVCFDPINDGNVTYVPLETLQKITGIEKPNIIILKVMSTEYIEVEDQIRNIVEKINPEFEIFTLNEV